MEPTAKSSGKGGAILMEDNIAADVVVGVVVVLDAGATTACIDVFKCTQD